MYSIYAELRDKRGLSDYAVAKGSGVGRSTLSDWKTGKHIPNMENLKKIADFFNVSLEYLTTGKELITAPSEEINNVESIISKLDNLNIDEVCRLGDIVIKYISSNVPNNQKRNMYFDELKASIDMAQDLNRQRDELIEQLQKVEDQMKLTSEHGDPDSLKKGTA